MENVLKPIAVYKHIGFAFFLCYLLVARAWATSIALPMTGNVVGEIEYVHPQAGETLGEIGLRYDMGYDEMVRANPSVHPTHPLSSALTVLIPSQFILPSGPHRGIVINLAEYRLYFFPEGDNVVMTYPVGIGRQGWSTPLGTTKVIVKQLKPVWHPSAALIARAAKEGVLMPPEFPSNRSNPLGQHALRLGWSGYLIHGTQRRGGVGERVSAGCIRMLPEDIEYLFEQTPLGTTVRVVNEPLKRGYAENGALYIEMHPSLSKQKNKHFETHVRHQFAQWGLDNVLHLPLIRKEMKQPSGIPRKIA